MPSRPSTAQQSDVSGYSVPFTGAIPRVLCLSETNADLRPSNYVFSNHSVYRQEIVADVTSIVREISDVLERLGAPEHDADAVLKEAPDDASYQDAYVWEPASVRVHEEESAHGHYSGDSGVWR